LLKRRRRWLISAQGSSEVRTLGLNFPKSNNPERVRQPPNPFQGVNILDESSGTGDDGGGSNDDLDILPFWYSRQDDIVSLNDILDTYAMKFYLVGYELETLAHSLRFNTALEKLPIHESHVKAVYSSLDKIKGYCDEIRLHNVSRYIQKQIESPKDSLTGSEAFKILDGVKERLEENLGTIRFKFVPPDESPWYGSKMPLGQEVLNKFPSASYDIDEAVKCRVLGRYTACVMHLMRVCEVGLKAYGTSLNVMAQIKSAQADWGTILRIANDEIQKLNKSGDPTWTTDKRRFFEETHAYFHSVRVAFRNRSMHADQQYGYVRAKEIYEAVRVWVRFMAEHLDDLGNYTP